MNTRGGGRRFGRCLAACAAALALALGPATAATAADGHTALPTGPASSDAVLTSMAHALRADPVLIDPSMAHFFTPAQRTALEHALRGAAFRSYLLVVPSFDQDQFHGSLDVMAYRLSKRLGPGLYLTVTRFGRVEFTADEVPRDTFDLYDERSGQRLTGAGVLTQVRTDMRNLAKAGHRDPKPADRPYVLDPSTEHSDSGSAGDWAGIAVVGTVCGVLGYLLLILVIGLVRRRMRLPFLLPRRPRRIRQPYPYRAGGTRYLR